METTPHADLIARLEAVAATGIKFADLLREAAQALRGPGLTIESTTFTLGHDPATLSPQEREAFADIEAVVEGGR